MTRGTRTASFFWLQSMVRDDNARTLLFDLDQTIQQLSAERGIEDDACMRLTGIYHNLIDYRVDGLMLGAPPAHALVTLRSSPTVML